MEMYMYCMQVDSRSWLGPCRLHIEKYMYCLQVDSCCWSGPCRLYIEKYSTDPADLDKDAAEALGPLINVALDLSRLREFTGRDKPTVIT